MPRRTSRGPRRQTRWVASFNTGNSITAATPEAVSVIASATSPGEVGATVLRVVGNISYAGRTVDTDSIYAVGLIVAPNTMDAADMDPNVNTDLDWLWIENRGFRQPAYDGVDSFENFWIELDLKGRRKLHEGTSLFLCQNAVGQTLTSFVNLRILLMLP